MRVRIWLLSLCFCVGGIQLSSAQNSRKVRALQSQKKEIQQGLKKKQSELSTTKKHVEEKMRDISMLTNQLENRQRYIADMEHQIKGVDQKISVQEQKLAQNERDLERKKQDYIKALRFARLNKSINSPLLFVLSTQSVTQMYRRSRYAREYANYERTLAEQIVEKQNELLAGKNELLKVKGEKHRLVNECEAQRAELQRLQDEEKRNVAGLQKRQKVLSQEVETQKRQLAALDRKIDEMIAREVEEARRRAEQEARKREEARRRQEEARRKANKNNKTTAKSQNTRSTTKAPATSQWLTSQDRALNGSFEKNKGRLPVPITGSYMIGSRFGTYNVPGLKNVRLDNKGTNYIGKPGAKARAIFDGEVSAVFQFGGTKNVLVRHGSYISVYCNLSSVIVAKGQKVKARDILGSVDNDGSGNCVLHFQLRKETVKLNPEAWIGR